MIPIIQQTVVAADFRHSRHLVREQQMEYIRRRKRMFRRIFVTEYKERLAKFKTMNFHLWQRKKYRVWKELLNKSMSH